MHTSGFSYRVGRAFWSVLRAYLLECLRGEVFNYFLLLLPRQLDGTAVFNNCSGYNTVVVYSFWTVLTCIFWIFLLGMVFHARMNDVQTSIQEFWPEYLMCKHLVLNKDNMGYEAQKTDTGCTAVSIFIKSQC